MRTASVDFRDLSTDFMRLSAFEASAVIVLSNSLVDLLTLDNILSWPAKNGI